MSETWPVQLLAHIRQAEKLHISQALTSTPKQSFSFFQSQMFLLSKDTLYWSVRLNYSQSVYHLSLLGDFHFWFERSFHDVVVAVVVVEMNLSFEAPKRTEGNRQSHQI